MEGFGRCAVEGWSERSEYTVLDPEKARDKYVEELNVAKRCVVEVKERMLVVVRGAWCVVP